MKERLIEFLAYLEIGQKKFEQHTGLANGFVNNVGDSIREASLAKITAAYPELNINWLKTGEGEMLRPVAGEHNKITAKGRGDAARTLNKGGVAGLVEGDLHNHGVDGETLMKDKREQQLQHMFKAFLQEIKSFHDYTKRQDEYIQKQDDRINEQWQWIDRVLAQNDERDKINLDRLDRLIDQLIKTDERVQSRADKALEMLDKKM